MTFEKIPLAVNVRSTSSYQIRMVADKSDVGATTVYSIWADDLVPKSVLDPRGGKEGNPPNPKKIDQ